MKFCPHCSLILDTTELNGNSLCVCHSCGGIWTPSSPGFTPKEISDVDLASLMVRSMTTSTLSVFEGLPANCPDCRTVALKPSEEDTHQRFKALYCSKCGGAWFDPIQMPQAIAPASMSVGMNEPISLPIDTTPTAITPSTASSSPPSPDAKGMDVELDTGSTPSETILNLLKRGNLRFASEQALHPDQDANRRTAIASNPSPVALVICCSDARVPPEIVLDQGLGSLFVVRTAGLVIDQNEFAAISYAVSRWNTRLILALGHSQCAAVTEALDNHWFSSPLLPVLKALQPRFASLPGVNTDKVDAAVRSNVQYVMDQIFTQSKAWNRDVNRDNVLIAGGVYDMTSGLIDWIVFTPSPSRLPGLPTGAPQSIPAANGPEKHIASTFMGGERKNREEATSESMPPHEPSAAIPPKITLWCPRCLAGYPASVQFCTLCGVALVGPNARIKCIHCGKANTINVERCWNCQTLLHPQASSPPSHAKITTPIGGKGSSCSTGVIIFAVALASFLTLLFHYIH